jgi:hypothetical protein
VWLGEEDFGVAHATQAQQIKELNEQQGVLFLKERDPVPAAEDHGKA